MKISRLFAMNGRSSSYIFLLAVIVLIAICLEYQIQNISTQNSELLNKFSLRSINDGSKNAQSNNLQSSNMVPVVLYNRVPKTGSTSFTNLIYKFSGKNNIYVLHINTTKNSHIMSLQDQRTLVKNITTWDEFKPAFYHGHMSYVDFQRFGSPISPLYINIIREPLDRLVSYYYFLRYGDDLRKGLKRARQGDKTTFDECVKNGGRDCQPEKMLWMQIPFFCGQSAECWIPGSQWALEKAKDNLVNNYMLVGMTERIEEFIVTLEATVPELFSGITAEYRKGNSHIRSTLHKDQPSDETVNQIKSSDIWKMENEFYQFAVAQFDFIKSKSTYINDNGLLVPNPRNFRYEKIYGPDGHLIQK